MKFTKMHGLGNDFVVVDTLEAQIDETRLPDVSRRLCDRHFGIGSDGLILVLPSRAANFRMRMLNPDGSEAEMCGNGIRCFGKYVYDHGLTKETALTVETLPGIQQLKLTVEAGKATALRVDMGEPRWSRADIPMRGDNQPAVNETLKVEGERLEVTCVSMGNPHCLVFVKSVDSCPVEKLGPAIETHNAFPQRTNVHFVEVLDSHALKVRTWERGAGITLACGTGACACVVAAALTDRASRSATVHLPGGPLEIQWQGHNHVVMTGPAEEVFHGEICL
ncbi:MAG: diaminopimelate epimerase [Armatimonadetes bacterium CG_4_10_14_3_um_filter_66_18]|nr:diaminopimelate epimerase [Armatimonadota bacterium]OIP04084.1 MAG: diaminopimelate epimerase [Armatimonadetes bacterium CG2_30_66_41]PIU87693.1 MAG: diaminopimelate epimerase [Armatimonadetes bacterium CG06_land_8_20_14_3_00_66_21]PIX46640.1 MAG: diaminopimelate epimerase [Armatimonadetes bacterium CG_4_8_14_3_um_filter_66_20]PIY48968.1 MAG: diaminopimelate epimerase [Armatimonadetes bacterium CG_4_10_14_3_um_filter_66_18]PIZ49124.1 MAG: diaminopimelate epimerase [Armatimonadetes bacterium